MIHSEVFLLDSGSFCCFFACLHHLFFAIDTQIGKATLGDVSFSQSFYRWSYLTRHVMLLQNSVYLLSAVTSATAGALGGKSSRFCKCWLRWLPRPLSCAFHWDIPIAFLFLKGFYLRCWRTGFFGASGIAGRKCHSFQRVI